MTSTSDCFAVIGDTPPFNPHEARDRFLGLVADARAAVQAALEPRPYDGAHRVDDLGEDVSGERPAAGERTSTVQRLEQVVSVLLGGHVVERAEVRVVG